MPIVYPFVNPVFYCQSRRIYVAGQRLISDLFASHHYSHIETYPNYSNDRSAFLEVLHVQ